MTSDKVPSDSALRGDTIDPIIRPIVICGPSGSGKSSLLRRLINDYKDYLGFTVSHTTRKPREGEIDGREYHFMERDSMEKAIKESEFIEFTEFSGNLYGTSKKAMEHVQNSGKICILDLEIEGVKNMKKSNFRPLFIFVKPPSLEVLEQRLRARATESDENIERRLKRAKEDLNMEGIENYFDLVLINEDLDQAYAALKNFIQPVIEVVKASRTI
ncbi:guanylate kinase-like [Panonychus citri]|uniref:guanylate kinase-like n=1 Tax=Panonychus citri TaxID=50023 RepID=UPI0023071875|nr:guanylate kinase-like [Panonychus citri]